jgi:hypothetical protein
MMKQMPVPSGVEIRSILEARSGGLLLSMSDIHLQPYTGPRSESCGNVNSLRPDWWCGSDYVGRLYAIFEGLSSCPGLMPVMSYSVLGNHDLWLMTVTGTAFAGATCL